MRAPRQARNLHNQSCTQNLAGIKTVKAYRHKYVASLLGTPYMRTARDRKLGGAWEQGLDSCWFSLM